MSQKITIVLNGETQEYADNVYLFDIIKQLGIEGSRYAIEVNEEIIPRSEHENYSVILATKSRLYKR